MGVSLQQFNLGLKAATFVLCLTEVPGQCVSLLGQCVSLFRLLMQQRLSLIGGTRPLLSGYLCVQFFSVNSTLQQEHFGVELLSVVC